MIVRCQPDPLRAALLASWIALLACAAPVAAQEERVFFDDFQGSDLNPAFRVLNPDPRRMALTQGEYLLLVYGDGDANVIQYNGDLPGSYNVTIRVVDPPSHHMQFVQLRVGSPADNVHTTAYYWNAPGRRDGLTFNTNHAIDGEYGQEIRTAPGDFDGEPFFLRLAKVGVEYEGFWSSEGENWPSVGKRVLVDPSATIQITAFKWGDAPQTPVKIDSFEITEILN